MCRFLCLIFILAAMPLLFAASVRQKTVKQVRYSNLYDLMSGNKFRTFEQKGSFNAVGRGYLCVFDKDQRRMLCNNGKIELLHVPHSENNSLWVSNLDWFKTLRPLLFPATVPRKKITSIMIDMGHGGKDPGALGAISKEKMITLKVGLRLAEILRSYGFQVHMTRTSDIYVPIDQIGAMQKRYGSDLFVSVHVNSTSARTVKGIETYCLTPAGAASSNGGKISNTVYAGNKQDPANFLLAWNIQQSLLRRTGAVDRGVKRARFAVLRDINAPGVLVEIGFITNAGEERKLNEKSYIDKVAYGIVDGIVQFSRTTKPK
ncbi:MAG: N-acetylmuramoyl-L-alanine amidase [Lentisphaerae bacterium]|nr:N-acetylmuramoyl-L-alanine amidase [Lentisphaerota bacterium]